MKTRSRLTTVLLFAALIFAGCVSQQQEGTGATNQNVQAAPSSSSTAAINTPAASEIAGGAGAGSNEATETQSQFEDWASPDGALTLQKPVGWTASERQVDTCTVNWAVTSPDKKSEAFMNNQILVFKSENAKQIYKQYGTAGIDASPVSGYLKADEAVAQVVAPLSGLSAFQVTGKNSEMSLQFSQAVCISGLAACDAQVFQASFSFNGIQMKGEYLVQSLDLGDGSTWWINVWGYSSPASEWNEIGPLLDKTFTSVKYTGSWAAKCQKNAGEASTVINDVIKRRQESADKTTAAWDDYIRG